MAQIIFISNYKSYSNKKIKLIICFEESHSENQTFHQLIEHDRNFNLLTGAKFEHKTKTTFPIENN